MIKNVLTNGYGYFGLAVLSGLLCLKFLLSALHSIL